MSAPRLVLLTASEADGLRVLRALVARGAAPVAVVVQSDAALGTCFRSRGWRRALELPRALARSGRRAWLARRRAAAFRPLADRVVLSGARNSARMCRDLRALAPDLLVLGGMGLVSREVLASARWGAINGHPGLLPWIRGSGVVAQALARGFAVGASCHLVDAGIDRGAIVERRLLVVAPDASLVALEQAAVELAADMVADAAAAVVASGAAPTAVAQGALFPLCRWASVDERRLVDAAVRTGRATALFDAWSPHCRPTAPPWRLPAHASGPVSSGAPGATGNAGGLPSPTARM